MWSAKVLSETGVLAALDDSGLVRSEGMDGLNENLVIGPNCKNPKASPYPA